MKKIMLSTFAMIVFCLTISAIDPVAEGKTCSALGNYRITESEKQFVVSGKELNTYEVSYDNSDIVLTIAIDKTPKCSKYYVISDALNVQYICSAKSFGVAKLDKRIEKEGYKTSNEALNKEAFLQQRVITAGNGNDVENAKMIASYFPLLLKNQNS